MPKPPKHTPAEYLWGRRQAVRHARQLDVECVGTGTTIRARTIDLARGGMLVEAHDGGLPRIGQGDLVPLAVLVAVAFKGGMKAILAPEVSVSAEVVRVTTSPVDPGFLRLGCRFTRMLTPRQCGLLGIDDSDGLEAGLDLGGPTADGRSETILPVELVEVTARPGKRKPALKLAPVRERRRRDL